MEWLSRSWYQPILQKLASTTQLGAVLFCSLDDVRVDFSPVHAKTETQTANKKDTNSTETASTTRGYMRFC